MSYCADVKSELCSLAVDKSCDKLSELTGAVAMCGSATLSGGSVSLRLDLESPRVLRRLFTLIKDLTGIRANPEKTLSAFKKNATYSLFIPGDEAGKLLSLCFKYDGGLFFTPVPRPEIIKKACCRRAFLRGAFLGGGIVTDPSSSYRLEIVTSRPELAKCLERLMGGYGLNVKTAERRGDFVVYLKTAEKICDFFSIIGAYSSLLNFENIRIIKEKRNMANRMANCDSANITKAVGAALRQIDSIEFIRGEAGLDSLPEGLRQAAIARLEFPEAPLSELSQTLGLSRSGLNHRLKKLIEISDKLKEEKGLVQCNMTNY